MSKNTNPKYDEEIGMKELVQIFWHRRVFIVIFLVVVLLAGTILSLFFIPKEYKSTAIILVTPQALTPSTLSKSISFDDPFSWIKAKTKTDYFNGLLSPELLRMMIERLELHDSPSSLRGDIEIREIAGTSMIEITVVRSDPEEARRIAQAVCDCSAELVTSQYQKEWEKVAFTTDEMIQRTSAEATEVKKKHEEFLDEFDIPELRLELDTMQNQVLEQESKLRRLDANIDEDYAYIQALLQFIEEAEDFSWDTIQFEINRTTLDRSSVFLPALEVPGKKMRDAILIANYTTAELRLLSAMSERAVTEEKMDETHKRAAEIEKIIDLYGDAYDELKVEYDLKSELSKALTQRKLEINNYLDGSPGSMIIRTETEASLSAKPDNPNVLVNILLSGIIGLVLALSIVYFRDVIWNSAGAKPTAEDGEEKSE